MKLTIRVVALVVSVVGGVGPVVAPAASASRAPGPEISVSPSSGLVDGDAVVVEGRGFAPGELVSARLCVSGTDACRQRQSHGDVAIDGTVALSMNVRTLIDTGGSEADCRAVPCEIRVTDGPRLAIVGVSFDPDGAILQPSITVTPSQHLRDDDVVLVEGTGFVPGEELLVTQRCPQPYVCADRVVPGADGRFELDLTISETSYRYHLIGECRGSTPRCPVLVFEPDTWVLLASAPVQIEPDGRERISVSPTSGLRDGDLVRVDATGLNPGHELVLAECVVVYDGYPFTDCAAPPRSFTVPESGDIHATLTVRRRFTPTSAGSDTTYDCRRSTCEVAIGGDGIDVYIGSTATGTPYLWQGTPLEFADDGTATPATPVAVTPRFTG